MFGPLQVYGYTFLHSPNKIESPSAVKSSHLANLHPSLLRPHQRRRQYQDGNSAQLLYDLFGLREEHDNSLNYIVHLVDDIIKKRTSSVTKNLAEAHSRFNDAARALAPTLELWESFESKTDAKTKTDLMTFWSATIAYNRANEDWPTVSVKVRDVMIELRRISRTHTDTSLNLLKRNTGTFLISFNGSMQ